MPQVGTSSVPSSGLLTVTVGSNTSVKITNTSNLTVAITISSTGAIDGQSLVVRFYDFSASPATLSWSNTESSAVAPPGFSNGSTVSPITVGFIYNGATSKWRCVGYV